MIQPDVAEKYIGKEVEISTYKMFFSTRGESFLNSKGYRLEQKSAKITHVTKTTLTIEYSAIDIITDNKPIKVTLKEFDADRDKSYIYYTNNGYYKELIVKTPIKKTYEVALSAIVYITEREEC